ncbi:energy transducer TonB [Azohydromonas lata]|uniref:TonB family protein n=1 Tax=Azohydromonas lata TaxID=45677 RepID=A0ABU5IAF9_9BURK|nr:TonB family protein [Azohydromonas lata]MDZ5456087.1 TonB family protein [Azohydromonas lata]
MKTINLPMQFFSRIFIAISLLVFAAPFCCAANESWPSTVVKIEDLRTTSEFEIRIPAIVVKGKVTGPAIIRAHVATDGAVVRTALLSSCGNADLDEASLRAIRAMRFDPYLVNGEPTDVSLVLPVHIPKNFGRSR